MVGRWGGVATSACGSSLPPRELGEEGFACGEKAFDVEGHRGVTWKVVVFFSNSSV